MSKTKKLVFISLLIAQAMILSFIENSIPFSLSIMGAKLGLANIISLTALYMFGIKEALIIVFMRTFITDILFGSMQRFLFSISGGILSVIIMYIVLKIFKDRISIIGVSVFGALFHSIGQIAMAAVVIQNIKIAVYLPYLGGISVVTGIFVGISSKYMLLAIRKVKP
ncbi:Gx transporter family protein [Abyssisolibacter fermentans]|uniref:Gx transporter family protein n=1 Tax=Abyssisolibacter fermentans TaxID=1766203 RepID=UPI0008306EB1|nr:Gx transporter family protein [Abyssisolibacter fermentans]